MEEHTKQTKRVLPAFATAAEEAEWWYRNRNVHGKQLHAAVKSGSAQVLTKKKLLEWITACKNTAAFAAARSTRRARTARGGAVAVIYLAGALPHHLRENESMSGIQFVTDEKGRKVGVLIDLKKHGAVWEDFWDGLVSESRRKEKGIPYEQYRARRLKGSRPCG
jgi:hypothetical protein